MKKLYICLSILMITFGLNAGSVKLGWALITDPNVTSVKVYGLPGTNGFGTNGLSSATFSSTTSATNTTLCISNLNSGYYSFVATAINGTLNLESIPTTNNVSTGVKPNKPLNFQIVLVP